MQNRSMTAPKKLYALAILALSAGIVGIPLAILAYLFF